MARAPFEVLVFLYRQTIQGKLEYALFQRSDGEVWQGVAGGGEDEETPLASAIRETQEEAGVSISEDWIRLQTIGTVPVIEFKASETWGEDLYVIPIYCFGAPVGENAITLSSEHVQMEWLPFEKAYPRLKFDGDRTALWELNQRLQQKGPRE